MCVAIDVINISMSVHLFSVADHFDLWSDKCQISLKSYNHPCVLFVNIIGTPCYIKVSSHKLSFLSLAPLVNSACLRPQYK